MLTPQEPSQKEGGRQRNGKGQKVTSELQRKEKRLSRQTLLRK